MSDLETRLTAALNADAPPAHDARFRVELLVRQERARFRQRVTVAVSVVAAVAALVALVAPSLEAGIAGDGQLAIVAGVVVAALFSVAALAGESPGASFLRRLAGWTAF